MSVEMDRPISQTSWLRYRRWIIRTAIAAAIAPLVLIFYLSTSVRSVRTASTSVTINRVESGVYHDFIPLSGKIVARDTIYLDALAGGRIERVLAQAGDTVTQGQPLVELSNTELELDVLEREGRLIESITQLQTYQNQLALNRVNNQKFLAQIDYDIIRLQRSLARRKLLASQALEPAETKDLVQDELDHDLKILPIQEEGNEEQERLRLQQLPQIREQLDKLQQDLKITHSKLDDLTVRAPVAGLLTAMDLKVGEHRNVGERLGEITPDTGYKLTAAVDEYYLGRVRIAQTASVDIGDHTWRLEITRTYPQVTNGTFNVDLAFDGTAPVGVIPGQSVQGKLALGNDAPGIILPAGPFLERTGGDWVFVVARDGESAVRRRIKVGRRNSEQVEILNGLQPGEQVITSDYTGLEHVDRVDLSK